jgi:5-methylcytosine-specific restriction endonuclease McrA
MVTTGASCVHCGADDDLVAHHKLPRRYGGQDLLENLAPVCRSCHPRVEQEAIAHAKLVWESPVPEGAREPRRWRRLPRPY